MIKHTEVQLVPFEDCGFARYPENPLVGEPVTVRCRMDQDASVPRLRVWRGGVPAVLEPAGQRENFFSFDLGPADSAAETAYQFFTDREESPVYRYEAAREITRASADSLLKLSDTEYVFRICPDLAVRVSLDDILTVRFSRDLPVSGTPVGEIRLQGSGNVSLVSVPGGLWKLRIGERTVFRVRSLTFRLGVSGRLRQITETLSVSCRHLFGTGERFHQVDQAGSGSSGSVTEHFTRQGDQTYLPVPFFMTEDGWAWHDPGFVSAALSFPEESVIIRRETPDEEAEDLFFFGAPKDLLKCYLSRSGPCALPPEWAFGVWISGNGWNCDAEVDEQLGQLKRNGYPASVMVLEQWSDERTFHIWHPERFPCPEHTIARIRKAGLHPVLWQIPVIKREWDGEAGKDLEEETAEALRNGYVIRRTDGTPYRVTERWFHGSCLPDFSNPAAASWWFGKRKYLLEMGVEGFKTDGGEFLFDPEVRLYDGSRGPGLHNRFPMLYEKAYADFLRENGVNGVLFSRAGYSGAQSVPIHWAGDQVSEWSELKAQLTAGISAGLSGVLFWGFDIGGFAGPLPEPELYLRATAFACFAPVMQWHSEPRNGQFSGGAGEDYNNDRSPWNMAEKWQDPALLDISRRFAGIRESLRPYLWREAGHCVREGRPMIAHLCLDWPDDPTAWTVHDEYMLGRELLVAPVVARGRSDRNVWLPKGRWTPFFGGEPVDGGRTIRVDCPLDRIPVFRKEIELHD